MSGYSGTPLAKKLGFKEGVRVRVTHAPSNYDKLVSPVPKNVTISNRITIDIDIWHMFTKSLSELEAKLPMLMEAIFPNGAIWVSWPKKSSGVPSTVTEDLIRKVALPLGLVDIKVCAVDETWSGLKLVVRKELRH
ncbi:MAG: DUF3052 domain-containing protein [Gammaproteobacteria bacterium]|nr:DUF3052 domain-containing protein [Gammaproteobacteria bacterium]